LSGIDKWATVILEFSCFIRPNLIRGRVDDTILFLQRIT